MNSLRETKTSCQEREFAGTYDHKKNLSAARCRAARRDARRACAGLWIYALGFVVVGVFTSGLVSWAAYGVAVSSAVFGVVILIKEGLS